MAVIMGLLRFHKLASLLRRVSEMAGWNRDFRAYSFKNASRDFTFILCHFRSKTKAPHPFLGNGAYFSLWVLLMMMTGGFPRSDVNLRNHTQVTSEGQDFE